MPGRTGVCSMITKFLVGRTCVGFPQGRSSCGSGVARWQEISPLEGEAFAALKFIHLSSQWINSFQLAKYLNKKISLATCADRSSMSRGHPWEVWRELVWRDCKMDGCHA